MRTQLWPNRGLMAALLMSVALACSNTTGPSVQAVAGNYITTQLNTTEAGTTTNQLAAGASIALTLNPDGTTAGRFIAPGDPDMDLAGTWTLNGTTVRLSHSADTFLRDTAFRVVGNTLVGDETFGSTRVQVTLTKQ